EARLALTLPPEAFTPPPKVSSAVVHLVARSQPLYPAEPKILEEVVARAFNQRRKMLRAALRGLLPDIETVLKEAGLDPTDRAETVPVEGFCALARVVATRRATP
ncbi:MAG: rRNA adenine N-6-methyltransferase family protein, partial [Pseudomonadota bacterium]